MSNILIHFQTFRFYEIYLYINVSIHVTTTWLNNLGGNISINITPLRGFVYYFIMSNPDRDEMFIEIR